jgi:hypothetical protein
MERKTDHEQIFLQMQLGKSLQRDDDGNVIFEVEASNENLDIEGQRVLQAALMRTKDYFLKNGVVSKDHKHRTFKKNGSYDLHEEFVIGEPLDVFTDGTSTMVRGKLYASNEYAQKFIKLLEDGSSRVKASVGGLVPRIRKTIEDGKNEVGEIVSVLWDDLALTITPVNPTVEPAVSMAKSLSSIEFVKALSIGHGTDSAQFTGGRALTKEDVGYAKNLLTVNEKAIASLVGAISDGDVTGEDEAESFLMDFGISKSDACDIVHAVCRKSNLFLEVFPMAKSAKEKWDEIKRFLNKSTGSEKPEDDDDPDNSDGDLTNEGGDDSYEDAGPILEKALAKIESLEATIEVMAKATAAIFDKLEQSEVMQKSMGQGILALMDRTEEVIASPSPRKGAVTHLETLKAVMAKAQGGSADADAGGLTTGSLKPFTKERMDRSKDILTKAVGDGELSVHDCGRFETHMNKSMGKVSYPFPEDMVAFFKRKLSAA